MKGKPDKKRYKAKKGKGTKKPTKETVRTVPMGRPKTSMKDIMSCPHKFISRLKIVNKEGKTISLRTTTEQKEIINALQTGEDVLVLKPRQIGSSTISCAYLFWKFYTTEDSQTLAILSHKLSSAKHLLEICKRFYYLLPPFMQKDIELNNTTTFQLTSGAQIIAVSAEGKGGLRSFTCSHLMISEYAFSPNPDELKATALAALNNGQLIIESTASHYNDSLHREIVRVQRGLANWNFLFFKWTDHESYSKQPPPTWIPSIDEQDLISGGLTKRQVYWRHTKVSKIGEEKFSREFPLSIEEAYRQTGNSYFPGSMLEAILTYPLDSAHDHLLEPAGEGDKYAIGVDVSAGVGRDYSSAYVVSKRTNEVAYIFRSNKISPVNLAWKLVELGKIYNNALILIESNNYGHVVINEMKHQGYRKLWKCPKDKDWMTTGKSKKEMFENLKAKIESQSIKQIDNTLMAELRSLQVSEKGTIIIPDSLESHGDNAMAFALVHVCVNSIRISMQAHLPNWIQSKKARQLSDNSGASVGNHRRY